LIINELISNSLKHAFPGRRGQILIKAYPCDPDYCLLLVQDNGVGLPKHIDLHQTKTLGLRLVSGLAVQQLGGCIEIDSNDRGTAYRLWFKRQQ
jgi:two-component sensor histidine kinase